MFVFTVVLIPPIISFIKLFDLVNAKIAPIYNILDNSILSAGTIVNVINKIMEINIWINNKDRKLFSHVLKRKDVELWHNDIVANGANRINTLIII